MMGLAIETAWPPDAGVVPCLTGRVCRSPDRGVRGRHGARVEACAGRKALAFVVLLTLVVVLGPALTRIPLDLVRLCRRHPPAPVLMVG
jgi:hypothetical protein